MCRQAEWMKLRQLVSRDVGWWLSHILIPKRCKSMLESFGIIIWNHHLESSFGIIIWNHHHRHHHCRRRHHHHHHHHHHPIHRDGMYKNDWNNHWHCQSHSAVVQNDRSARGPSAVKPASPTMCILDDPGCILISITAITHLSVKTSGSSVVACKLYQAFSIKQVVSPLFHCDNPVPRPEHPQPKPWLRIAPYCTYSWIGGPYGGI